MNRCINSRMQRLARVFFMVFISWPSISSAGLFGPSNYDECIVESMKGVTSDVAARAIIQSCQKKFPVKKPTDSELPSQALAKITGRAGLSFGSFRGSIYNGNNDYTITQITIVLIPKGNTHPADDFHNAKQYNVYVTVLPLTNSNFTVSVDSGDNEEFDWNITKARGYK
ncbi:MAG: hypothetical protein V1764_03310 [Nitrospirota bacterium]